MQPEKLPAFITLWTTCSFERQKISMWHPGCSYPIPLQFNLLFSERNRITSPFHLGVFHMLLKIRKFFKNLWINSSCKKKTKTQWVSCFMHSKQFLCSNRLPQRFAPKLTPLPPVCTPATTKLIFGLWPSWQHVICFHVLKQRMMGND